MRIFAVALIALASVVVVPARAEASHGGAATTTVYLPNVTKTLGGPDGWQTPFIVQNVGSAYADIEMDFFSFDGMLVKSRHVSLLAPGTSVFHDPNSDTGLPDGGQFAVVLRSYGSEIVAVVNEHQNVQNPARQEALSYAGLTSGSTHVYLPYLAKFVDDWLTTFIIQNVSSAPATVNVALVSYDGTRTAQLSRTILPGRSQAIDPSVEPLLAGGIEYTARIVSNQAVGVVVNAHRDAPTVAFPTGFSYNGIPATNEMVTLLPYVAKNADGIARSSRILVQNTGLSAATPRLSFKRLGANTVAATIDAPAAVAPGRVWVFDARTATQLTDGEYALAITNGQFAAVSATASPTTAMGYASQAARHTRIFLPNVTRTLGGTTGWTTPLIVQSAGASNLTVRWYRFSDGQLVYTSTPRSFASGAALRIDPRSYPLEDDEQYAVVIDAATGGAVAIVTELNQTGGDGAMAYEGAPRVPAAGFGTNSCTPATGAAGSSFSCVVFGLPAGAAVSYTVSSPTGTTQPTSNPEPVAPDGSWHIDIGQATIQGLRSVTITAGGISRSAQFTVTPPTFGVTITSSTYGSVAARTVPGAVCSVDARLPSGTFSDATELRADKAADTAGNVSWTYPTSTTTAGTGTHFVSCTVRDETHTAQASFTVP